MILDPNRKGIEVFYSNKLRVLDGGLEECTGWILEVSLCEPDDYDEDELKRDMNNRECHIVFFDNKKYVQYNDNKFYLDCNGFGGMWKDYFKRIGLEVDKLDVKRIRL